MDYTAAIAFLYAQLPMYSRIGAAAYKADLTNTIALLDALDHPEKEFRSIHIAGTNGKGSTASMLAAICTSAGYKTGLYTSPHIHHFEERIRINGEPVSQEFVTNFVNQTKALCETIQPSFFELTVAMAFRYFAHEKVDIAIIETGLGGRLDSTNVITPLLGIITNIGYDHKDMLGDTLEEIAIEKAGIIKKKVPVIIGKKQEETFPVFTKKAAEFVSPIYFAEDHFQIVSGNKEEKKFKDQHNEIEILLSSDLKGIYQNENIATVLTAIKVLQKTTDIKISEEEIKHGISHIAELSGLHGRWELVHQNPDVIYDVAHNAEGIIYVVQQFLEEYPGKEKHIVLGFVKDKDIATALQVLPKTATYYFTNAHIPRALPAAELAAIAEEKGLIGKIYDVPKDSLKSAYTAAKENGVVLVCGSFFVIAELPAKDNFIDLL